jgi:hypothetical protein
MVPLSRSCRRRWLKRSQKRAARISHASQRSEADGGGFDSKPQHPRMIFGEVTDRARL